MHPHEQPSTTAEWLSAIERYHAGECTPAEAEAVRAYLAEHPAVVAFLDTVRTATRPPQSSHFDVLASLHRLRYRLAAESASRTDTADRHAGRTRRFVSRSIIARVGWVAAAVVLLGLVVIVPGHHGLITGTPRERADVTEYTTSPGQRATIRFSDGGSVVLGPESRLRYAVGQRSGNQTLWLDGEAYFSVHHDPASTITVQTSHATTRVLGTVFVIKAYDNDPVTHVAVAEGKVTVTPTTHADATTLTSGDVGRFGLDGTSSVTPGADLEPYLGWTSGQLTFRGATLGAIARDLDRWCDLDIRFADPSLASTVLAVSFRTTVVDDILTTLTTTAGLHYTRAGRVVTLSR
jgi:ferric-dicitrate binding protein FerR (iron transport regulator)